MTAMVEEVMVADAEEVEVTVMDAVDEVVETIEDKVEVIMKPNVAHNIVGNISGENVQRTGRAMHTNEVVVVVVEDAVVVESKGEDMNNHITYNSYRLLL